MDERSVTRPSPPFTRIIVADEAFCAQASALLMCDPEPIHQAFLGEPVEEVLEMVRWALSHEDDEGFDPAAVLTAWAKRRGRGAWRPARANGTGRDAQHQGEADPGEGHGSRGPEGDGGDAELEAALRVARYWEAHPERLAEALRWPYENGRS